MTDPIFTNWRKSTKSSGGGNCVEVGHTEDGALIGVRDTKDLASGTLTFSAEGWNTFVRATKAGAYDLDN